MIKFLNVRGPNGAGKTTLLRCLARSPECRLVPVHQPLHSEPAAYRPEEEAWTDYVKARDRAGKPKGKPIMATVTPEGIALLGDYTPAASGTTAGCDRISRQDDIKAALLGAAAIPGVKLVIFEGVIVATIFGPWLEWERANGGMIWAFLDTPLDVCLKRIQDRNGGQPIKEDLVAAKHKTIQGVRTKALNAYPGGGRVVDIHWEVALKDFKETIAQLVDHNEHGEGPGAEDGPWAEGWPERNGCGFAQEAAADRLRDPVSLTLGPEHYREQEEQL